MTSDDDELLALIAQAVADDRPPDHLIDAAYHSRTWADIDAELAELIEDSADLAVAGVRSTETRRMVFDGVGVLDLEIDAGQQTLRGTVDPPGTVSIERPDGSTSWVEAAAVVSSFAAADVRPGPIRLTIQSPAGNWRTSWFTI